MRFGAKEFALPLLSSSEKKQLRIMLCTQTILAVGILGQVSKVVNSAGTKTLGLMSYCIDNLAGILFTTILTLITVLAKKE